MAKASHADAHYRAGSKRRRCDLCTMFRTTPKLHCTAVVDPIEAGGLCDYFERDKAKTRYGSK